MSIFPLKEYSEDEAPRSAGQTDVPQPARAPEEAQGTQPGENGARSRDPLSFLFNEISLAFPRLFIPLSAATSWLAR